MSAADSVHQAPVPADPKLHEPSMEEILASIRRIIADDQSLPGRLTVSEEEDRLRAILTSSEAAPSASALEPEPAPTVRAIFAPHPVAPEPAVQRMVVPQPMTPQPIESPSPAPAAPHFAVPQFAKPDAAAAVSPSSETLTPPPQRPAEPPVEPLRVESPSQPLQESTMSQDSRTQDSGHGESGSVSSLFSASTGSSVTAAFNTLAATRLLENDDALKNLARDMLRPMLKDWLDDNLPVLVERLVRAEIERVGRGGR